MLKSEMRFFSSFFYNTTAFRVEILTVLVLCLSFH